MTKHLIQQATLADLNFVLTCSRLLSYEEHTMNPKVHNERNNPHEAYLQSVLAGEQSDAFILRCDHCGCLIVNVSPGKKTIYLIKLYVLPQFRSQGIASELIDHIKAYRDENYPDYSIRLNCLRENPKDHWGIQMKNFARAVDISTLLRRLLSVIDSISVGGLTKQGFIVDEDMPQGGSTFTHLPEGVVCPDDFVCQPPAWTLKYKVGQCDSIAALIAAKCDKLGWKHFDFVTECVGISLWEASHFFTIIQTPLGFIRGDMSVDYMQETGLYRFYPTLDEALDAYCNWAKKTWHCKMINLYPYNASDRKYYGMDFNRMIEDIIGAKKPAADYSELLGMTYDPVATHTRTVNQLLRDRKGICFDFVNYLYQKNNCRGECYFLWFNDKNRSTHTIYIDPEGYWIEATPDSGIPLQEVRRNKVSLNKIINHLVKQRTGGVKYADDNPLYYCVRYVPENRRMTLDEFFNRRFDEIGV